MRGGLACVQVPTANSSPGGGMRAKQKSRSQAEDSESVSNQASSKQGHTHQPPSGDLGLPLSHLRVILCLRPFPLSSRFFPLLVLHEPGFPRQSAYPGFVLWQRFSVLLSQNPLQLMSPTPIPQRPPEPQAREAPSPVCILKGNWGDDQSRISGRA